MAWTPEKLVSVAKSYWPSSNEETSNQEFSPETMRLHELWEHKLGDMQGWWSFINGLKAELPRFSVSDATVTYTSCLRCVVYPLKPLPVVHWVVACCVSIIAPVYTVYGVQFEYPGGTRRITRRVDFDCNQPQLRAISEVVSKQFTSVLGVDFLSREAAETPVPLFVQWKKPPTTTLFHALFTSEPD